MHFSQVAKSTDYRKRWPVRAASACWPHDRRFQSLARAYRRSSTDRDKPPPTLRRATARSVCRRDHTVINCRLRCHEPSGRKIPTIHAWDSQQVSSDPSSRLEARGPGGRLCGSQVHARARYGSSDIHRRRSLIMGPSGIRLERRDVRSDGQGSVGDRWQRRDRAGLRRGSPVTSVNPNLKNRDRKILAHRASCNPRHLEVLLKMYERRLAVHQRTDFLPGAASHVNRIGTRHSAIPSKCSPRHRARCRPTTPTCRQIACA